MWGIIGDIPIQLPAQTPGHKKAECVENCNLTYLQNQQKEEVGIGNPLELLEKVHWQECKQIVFRGFNGIRLWGKKPQ